MREAANQRLWDDLYGLLNTGQRAVLDSLLTVQPGARVSELDRLRRGPMRVSGPQMKGPWSGRRRLPTWAWARVQLTDPDWEFIEPYLSIGEYGPYPERLRQQFEGVIWRFKTGGQWREMPTEFGAWSTVHNRFRQWRDAGVFEALLEGLITEAAKRGEVDLSLVSIDSTTARAHHGRGRGGEGQVKGGGLEEQNEQEAESDPALEERRRIRRRRKLRLKAASSDVPEAGRPARSTSPPTASAARWRSS